MESYVDAMIVDTPILKSEFREQLHQVKYLEERLTRAQLFIEYLDQSWRENSLNNDIFNWEEISEQIKREIKKNSIKKLNSFA